MNRYKVLVPGRGGSLERAVEVTAEEFDITSYGVLVFTDRLGKRVSAFREWVRIDRLA